MLDKQGFGTHRELLVSLGVDVMNLAAAQGVAVEEVHVDHHGEGVPVGGDAGQLASGIRLPEALRAHHFGCDEIRGADDVGGKLAGHHQTIQINDGGRTVAGIDEHVSVRKIRVGQARTVQAFHGASDFDADEEVFEPIAELGRIEVELEILVPELGRGEPFTLLFLAFDRGDGRGGGIIPDFEEKLPLIRWHHHAGTAVMLYHGVGPAEKVLPVFSARTLEDAFAIFVDDVVETLLRGEILFVAKKGNHIGAVGAEIDVLHPPLHGRSVVHELVGLPVRAFYRDLGAHGAP